MAGADDRLGMRDTGSATLSPWTAVVAGWLLCGLLALLSGKTLHADAQADLPMGETSSWGVDATAWLDGVARGSGIADLVETAGQARDRAYDAHLRLGDRRAADPATPTDAGAGPLAGADDDTAGQPPGDDDDSADPVGLEGDDPSGDHPPVEGPPRPARILLVGASSIQFELGRALEHRFEEVQGITVERYGQHSTGLSRPDYFDWIAHAEKLRDEFQPDLVLAQFGGNDCQGMTDHDGRAIGQFGSDAWDEGYYARVRAFIDVFHEEGIGVVFLGMPIMRAKSFRAKMVRLNDVVQLGVEHAAQEDGAEVLFISTHAMTVDETGDYMELAVVRDRRRIIRATDGAHLTNDGAFLVSGRILDELAGSYVFVPATPADPPAPPSPDAAAP